MRLHTTLFAGSCENLAICSHSAACRRNSSEGIISKSPRARYVVYSHLRLLSELRRTCRPAFHGLARGIIVVARGDTPTPAIPIRWPGSLDVHRTGPTYRPSSTYAHHVLGSCLACYHRGRPSDALRRRPAAPGRVRWTIGPNAACGERFHSKGILSERMTIVRVLFEGPASGEYNNVKAQPAAAGWPELQAGPTAAGRPSAEAEPLRTRVRLAALAAGRSSFSHGDALTMRIQWRRLPKSHGRVSLAVTI